MGGASTETSAQLRGCRLQDPTTSCMKSFAPGYCSRTQPLFKVFSRAEAQSEGDDSLDPK